MATNATAGNPAMSPTRYARVKEILNTAAGDSQAAYQGYGRFWNLPLAEFLEVSICEIRMIAPAASSACPHAGPPTVNKAPKSTMTPCCHMAAPSPMPAEAPDPSARMARSARSGLISGLRSEWPWDGTHFPPLPWGGARVAAADIQFIADWIDAGCPESEAAAADPQRQFSLAAGVAAHEVSVEDANAQRARSGALKLRQNALHLEDGELRNLRGAIQELKNLNAWPRDVRNYNAWAQLHGDECPHGWSTFLPWHRMYLWGFEQALQDVCPTVTLPYWDWASSTPDQIRAGFIPPAFRCQVTDAMLSALSGKVSAPTLQQLAKTLGQDYGSVTKLWKDTGPIPDAEQPAIIEQLKLGNPLFDDLRFPGEFYDGTIEAIFHHHYPTPEDIERILAVDNWRDFAGGMDVDQSFGVLDMEPHNTMHIWLGGQPNNQTNGDMLSNLTAAFDPIFWAHHGNVDRLWALWQERHPGAAPPDPTDVLPGVDATVQDSLSMRKLGYEYAADTYVFPTDKTMALQRFTSGKAGVRAPVLAHHRRAEVRLHGVRQPQRSFLVRVFLNLPQANASTSIENNDHYAGHFSLFGHGTCIGGPGHCDPRPGPRRKFDARLPHHNDPWNVRVDVTDTVRKLVAQGASDLQVNLVTISPGEPAKLSLEAVSFTFHD